MLLCCAELEPDSSDQFWTLAFFYWDFLSLWKQEFEDAAQKWGNHEDVRTGEMCQW